MQEVPMRIGIWLVAVTLTALAGCGGGDRKVVGTHVPPLNTVKGQVLLGKKPAGKGSLVFAPDTPIRDVSILAEVGDDGRFEVVTIDTSGRGAPRSPGAPEGTYRVTYLPFAADQADAPLPVEAPAPVQVKAGDNEITIQLPPPSK